MSSVSNDEESTFRPFTKAERIQQLNDIDKSINQLLESAGLALKTLSTTQSSESTKDDRQRAFEVASNSYLETLQKVDVNLRRQIWGLEEANIIPVDKVKKVKDGQDTGPMGIGKSAAPIEIGGNDTGMGKLDIGWLNSRSGRVGRDMEAELWEKARIFLQNSGKTNGGINKEDEDEIMEH